MAGVGAAGAGAGAGAAGFNAANVQGWGTGIYPMVGGGKPLKDRITANLSAAGTDAAVKFKELHKGTPGGVPGQRDTAVAQVKFFNQHFKAIGEANKGR